MRTIVIEPEYEAWRNSARRLLAQGVAPDEVLWSEDPQEASLFTGEDPPAESVTGNPIKVPPAFLDMARSAAAHTALRRAA